jgi:MBG domain (YGX type)/Kelch motif/Galactose oxidase, central domain
MFPSLPTSRIRSLSNTTTRIAILISLVAVAVMVLASTNSSARSLGQRFFAGAATIISGGSPEANAAPANHSLHSEAEEATMQSSTMLIERRGHTATRLSDGRVLIAGGENSSGLLNQTELYDSSSSTFSAAASMGAARADHSATLLADGRVLIAGGRNGGGALETTEIFDPTTGVFTNGPSMSVARAGHSATLFANGRVFVAGGESGGSAEVLDVSAGTSTAAGTMGVARSMHSAALLQDGRVLIAGGKDASGNALASGEIFDTPASTFWTIANDLKTTRVRAHLRVLFDGKVQIIGGSNDGSMEIYDPVFEGFGAYAHVLPVSDPCTGLRAAILAAQTRAALFHNGQADALVDRSGHTITELGGQALVLGGVNSSGAVLNSSAVIASSSASITTDKMDYAPGEIAKIAGRGFQPGEVVRLKIHEDPHTPQERGFDATADAEGKFSGEYLVMDYDLNMKFIVGARGLTSGFTAQTTFTDSNPQTIAIAAPTSVTVIQGATANYGNQTLTVGGNANACTVTFNVTPALPAGATPVWGTNPVITTGANVVTTFSVTTTAATPTGTYTFQVTGTNSGAGCQGPGPTPSNTLTLIVNSATVNTTTAVTNASATYGDASVTLNATVTPASGPAVNNGSVSFTVKQGATTIGVATTDTSVVSGAASVNYLLPAGTDAGPYTIEADYTAGTGFNPSSGSGTLTINQRAIEVTADAGQFKTYGDADPAAFTYTITNGSLVPPDAFTGALSRVAGENAGLYAITIGTLAINDGNGGNNYNLSFVSSNFEIKKRAATWTTNPASKTYGDADPSPLTTGSGSNFVAADNVTATYARVAGENASPPTYHITATLSATPLSALDNYIITNDGAEFTINKRLATWTTNPGSKTYGDADPAPLTSGSGSNFVAADNVTATYARVAGENASPPTYHITATLSATPPSALDNYIITNDGAEFTINKRVATWTTNPGSKTYGDADPSPLTTGSGSNFVAADNVTATYARVAGENASPPTYHITATLSATPLSALDNYIITNDGAEFTINKRLATWTTSAASKTYGDADPAPLTTGSGSNFVAADNVTATYARVAGENASPPTYHITATLSATPLSALDNYIITNDGAEFTINKRLATWTTNPASKTYGDADPAPLTTGSGSNFVAADNVTATYARVAGENASPPTYHITATLSATPLSALDNYIITNDGAEFTINKRLATWTTNPASKTYGDADPAPLTTGSGSNFVAADNVTATYARVAGENASPPTYHITATLSATPLSALDNYIITNDGAEFTIDKRLATWTTDGASKTYGDADPAPLTTGSGSNFVAADNVTATYARVAGENASPPTYHITATLSATPLSALDNYIITNDGAEFTINKRLATWTTNPASKTYGNADPAPLTTGSGSNFVAADNVTATYTRAAGENASPPTYHITATLSATPLSALDNYIITNNGAEVTINKRPIQITATAGQFKTYGDLDPTFAYTITSGSLAGTDAFTGALSRVAGQNVGLYAITLGSLAINDGNGGNNYNLSFVSNNFEIKKRPISVKADPKTKTFGDPDPVFTYQITSGSLAFSDMFTGALTRDPGELVGTYAIKIGTLAINDGNGGANYTLTFTGDNLTILTACSVFNGFLSPIGGSVESGNGGSFTDPVRAFKLNSTIPVKFNATCFGVPLTTGIHTLQATKYSNATDSDPAIDATPTDAATTGNQFRLTGTEWHFNLSTKGLGNNGHGTWLLKATLFDGSTYSVWVSVKK